MKTRSVLGRVFVIAFLILLVDVAGALVVGTIQLHRAAAALDDAARALRQDDITAAIDAVTRASAASDSVETFTQHPGFKLVGLLPFVGDDIDAFAGLVDATSFGTQAAHTLVSAIEDLDGGGGIIDAFYSEGSIDLDAMDALTVASQEAVASIDEARVALTGLHPHLDSLDNAIQRGSNRLDSIAAATDRGLGVADVLPAMVGADGPRKYLLAFQSPSEARGGGGLIGVFGILSASDGHISLDEVAPIEELGPQVRPSVHAPPAYSALYAPLGALRDWRQANLSPNFPATSSVLLDMYQRVRHEQLDGVIALDPLAVGEMIRGTGPLRAEGWGRAITRKNVRRLLLFKIYKHFVNQENLQNVYLRGLVNELWSKVEHGEVDGPGLLEGFNAASSKHHLKFYSRHPEEQSVLVDIGVAADPTAVVGPLQLVFNNNNSGNKLDFFLHRHQDIDIRLDEDGTAHVVTSIRLTNDLPKNGLRSVGRSGVKTGLRLGASRMSVHFMLPRGARAGRFQVDGRSVPSYGGRDGEAPVEWSLVQVPPEGEITASLSYVLPVAVQGDVASGGFSFTLWPQATARPDSYAISVTAPPGYALARPGSGTEPVIRVAGRLKKPVELTLRVIPAEGAGDDR
jgi:hypothetical protein